MQKKLQKKYMYALQILRAAFTDGYTITAFTQSTHQVRMHIAANGTNYYCTIDDCVVIFEQIISTCDENRAAEPRVEEAVLSNVQPTMSLVVESASKS